MNKTEKAIDQFARECIEAKENWDKTPLGWLHYYEQKQEAYDGLVERLPEAAYVENFWSIVTLGPEDWQQKLMDAVNQLHKGTLCRTCRATLVKWPIRNCDTCIAEKKMKLEATKESRKALKKRLRKKTKPKSMTRARYRL